MVQESQIWAANQRVITTNSPAQLHFRQSARGFQWKRSLAPLLRVRLPAPRSSPPHTASAVVEFNRAGDYRIENDAVSFRSNVADRQPKVGVAITLPSSAGVVVVVRVGAVPAGLSGFGRAKTRAK
jgi:hypothetical protein